MNPEPTASEYRELLAFVRRRVDSPGRAEEITQEVYASMAAALADSAGRAPRTLGWLYTVARRRIVDEARRSARSPAPVELVPGTDHGYGALVARSLQDALERLTAPQREVVVLRLLRGVSFAEIAAKVGITEEAARMRFMRGLEQLRAELERAGVAP